MKKFIIIAALFATMPVFADHVDPETARKVATTFLSNNGAKSTQLTDLSKSAGFPNLYIFTAKEGFVVMSADDCVKPILGYSLTGSFETEGMPENVRGWLQGYSDEIQYAIDNQAKAASVTAQQWNDLAAGKPDAGRATVVVEPLVQTQWNQNGYDKVYLFNNLCPEVASGGHGGHAVVGCVATAMAQIMKYWEYPSKGIRSHSDIWNGDTLSADFGATTYEWQLMTNTYSNNSTTQEKYAVDLLMFHCGVSVNMNYRENGSSAYSVDVTHSLKEYFNYSTSMSYKNKSDYSDDAWITMLKSELDATPKGRPLQYRGKGSGGHSFICDGYNSDNYFHFNWGWAGKCDGYYPLDNLTTYDPGTGGGNGSYTNDQAAIFGIQPVQCTASAPSNLTYSITEPCDVTLYWTAGTGASSYNIYRNGLFVGNSIGTTFNTTALFGANDYYVRSVDAEGNMSLATDYAKVSIDYPTPIVDNLTATPSENHVSLSWTAPDWCYPKTASAILTYGEGTSPYDCLGYHDGTTKVYWGHRYPSDELTKYDGLCLYRVSFYAVETGRYKLFVYEDTSSDLPKTKILEQLINTPTIGWNDIDLTNSITIDGSHDLWVFLYDDEARAYPVPYIKYSGNNGNYATTDPSSWIYPEQGIAFLIRTYLTDGTYTYNLYQDGVKIAEDLTDTNYSNVSLSDDAPNQFTVKTNYYGGEAASNVIGFAKGNASLSTLELGINDKMTVMENSALTVSGELSNNTPSRLVLEDGSQLITSSDNVAATLKKNIAGYGSNNDVETGWYFIASPISESYAPTSTMLSNTYDLYRLNNTIWENYLKHTQDFTITNGTGYLYANSGDVTLEFAGTILPFSSENNANKVSLADGWNLVGNPYSINVYSDKPYYKITTVTQDNVSRNVISPVTNTGDEIAPCEGIIVHSNGTGYIAFSKEPVAQWSTGQKGNIEIVLTEKQAEKGSASAIIDKAIVSFNKESELPKFYLGSSNANIFIPKGDQDYAIVSVGSDSECNVSPGVNELPVYFKAYQNGTYTLTFTETANCQLPTANYLHLIDNLTGADIDLLTTPSYEFEAKTHDYASRFKLVFNAQSDDDDSDCFAFVSDEQIIITGNIDDAVLQVVDLTGRIVLRRDGAYTVSTDGMAPGVYVLRLITENNIKTQKIFIK